MTRTRALWTAAGITVVQPSSFAVIAWGLGLPLAPFVAAGFLIAAWAWSSALKFPR